MKLTKNIETAPRDGGVVLTDLGLCVPDGESYTGWVLCKANGEKIIVLGRVLPAHPIWWISFSNLLDSILQERKPHD